MKNIKSKLAVLFLGLFIGTSFISCDEGGDPDPGGTTTEKLAGDWHIVAYEEDGTQASDYMLYSTYNASSNDENFWIDDHNNPSFQLKTKVQVNDFNNLTFSGPVNALELYTEGTVTISNGKVIPKGGKSFGGHVVDSLYFEAEFDWDPGIIYKFGGHKRTGFLEDEL